MMQIEVISFNPTLESRLSLKELYAHPSCLRILLSLVERAYKKNNGKGELIVLREKGRIGEE